MTELNIDEIDLISGAGILQKLGVANAVNEFVRGVIDGIKQWM